MSQQDLYAVLGVTKSASAGEIEQALRMLRRREHPDRKPAEQKEAAEARYKEIAEAGRILTDAGLRQAYDSGGMDAVKKKESGATTTRTPVTGMNTGGVSRTPIKVDPESMRQQYLSEEERKKRNDFTGKFSGTFTPRRRGGAPEPQAQKPAAQETPAPAVVFNDVAQKLSEAARLFDAKTAGADALSAESLENLQQNLQQLSAKVAAAMGRAR